MVLERADRLGVSVCGSLLAELGATVLQVGGAAFDIGLTGTAQGRAVTLGRLGKIRVEEAASGAAWLSLVARADVVLLGDLRPEDHALLARERDCRVVCALSAFGADAPPGASPAGETAAQAAGGL
ncbi:hypothetical protein, partial [Enterovirga sp.]|uniref:hypothetical protein n=1 Tax=Enterovirga sp. TaxID=2026350 RepID=UPI0026156E05